VIVVVAEESSLDARPFPSGRRVEWVADAGASVVRSSEVLLVVLDATSVDGARELLAEFREEPRFPPAIVAVLAPEDLAPPGLLPVDAVLRPPVEDAAFADAVRRGALAAEYDVAVEQFIDACADRAASDTTDPVAESTALAAARRSADAVLADVLDEPGLLADILQCAGDE
jgi:hypothetical protein